MEAGAEAAWGHSLGRENSRSSAKSAAVSVPLTTYTKTLALSGARVLLCVFVQPGEQLFRLSGILAERDFPGCHGDQDLAQRAVDRRRDTVLLSEAHHGAVEIVDLGFPTPTVQVNVKR